MKEQNHFKAIITGIFLNWCTYGGTDLTDVSSLQYPPNIRVIRIPRTGRPNQNVILQSFGNQTFYHTQKPFKVLRSGAGKALFQLDLSSRR